MAAFDTKLDEIVRTSETEAEEQSGLLLELVREVHSMRVLLVWVLVIVPAVVVAISIIGAVALAHAGH